MRIWKEAGIEIWNFNDSKRKTVHCYRGEKFTRVLLIDPPVALEGDDKEFGRECLRLVSENLEQLIEKWKESL